MQPTTASTETIDYKNVSFDKFIGDFKDTLSELFEEYDAKEHHFTERKFPDKMFKSIMDHVPLSVAIPSQYGGRGANPNECMSLLQAASYHSIPLTLIFGINIALFIEPFAKYGSETLKPEIFNKFLTQQHMGGLMITEPAHGSDALNMKTAYTQNEDGSYKIKGTKHWQGLTGLADYWLVAARKQSASGALGRDVDLFMTIDGLPEQHIEVTELYNNNGLYPIPYGKNEIDIQLPESQRLIPETTGIKMLMDTLHRSRLQFPGMAIGFAKRALDEATKYCNERMVRGNSLLQFDQIQNDLVRLESNFTICSSMCYRSSAFTSIEEDLALAGIEANTFKAVVSDIMQESAQILMQLQGGKGYLIKSLGSRAILDSRPFQIFEGPNDMLFTQLAEMMLKKMFKMKEPNLYEFMSNDSLSSYAAELFKENINISLEKGLPQRKLVLLGRTMAKVILAHNVITLGHSGFNAGMVSNCIDQLKTDVANLMNTYQVGTMSMPTETYQESSSWNDLLA